MSRKTETAKLFDTAILAGAVKDAALKLNPVSLARNPVIFVTEIVAALVTAMWIRDLIVANGDAWFSGQIAAWLWFTVLFANFAEAVAEGRGKAQAEALRRTRTDTYAKRLIIPQTNDRVFDKVLATELNPGISCWWRQATSSRPTAKSSKAWRASTSRPSPASQRR